MSQNPYEAPQTIALMESGLNDPARDLADVQYGAQLAFYALLVSIGVILADLFVMLAGYRELWIWLSWIFAIVGSLGILLQAWGIWLIRKAPPSSRVRLLVMCSAICLILTMIIYWSSIGLVYLLQDYRWNSYGYFLCIVGQYLSFVLLYWGLIRLGRDVQYGSLTQRAVTTLCYGAIKLGYDLYNLTAVVWSGDLEAVASYFYEQRNYFGHPWHFTIGMLGIALQLLTLRTVNKIPRVTELADSADSLPRQNNTSE